MSNHVVRGFDQIPLIIDIHDSQQDHIMDQLLADGCDLAPDNKSSLSSKRPRKILIIKGDRDGVTGNNKKKLEMHRENEKVRRQEMAKQYASLRSLLPLEYIKGKRSVTDHVQEAVKYINHLKGRITELDSKRDRLKKKLSHDDHTIGVVEPVGIVNSSDRATVTVGSCWCGVEISFNISSSSSSSLIEEGIRKFRLSKMIEELDGQKLSVVTCNCAKLNQRLLYTIQCEATDPASSIDLPGLQLMLTDVANTIFA